MPRSSRRSISWRALQALGALILLAGCAHLKRASPEEPDILWELAWESVTDDGQPFIAQGKAAFDSPNLAQSAGLLWRQEGERMRVDLSGFLGLPLASAGITGERAWLNVPLRAVRLSGTTAWLDSAAREISGLDLLNSIAVLLGRPPRQEGRYQTSRDELGNYLYAFPRGDSIAIYRLDPEKGRIAGYRLEVAGRQEYSVEYGDWRITGNKARPFSVDLYSRRGQAALSVRYSSISREQTFPGDVWEQP
jgi:outer membrane biogenesis lipoprotein LolB